MTVKINVVQLASLLRDGTLILEDVPGGRSLRVNTDLVGSGGGGGGGGGTPGAAMTWGGYLNGGAEGGAALYGNGDMGTDTSVNPSESLTQGELVSAFDQTFVWFAWQTEFADATTVVKVAVNGDIDGASLLALTGQYGVLACSISVNQGDRIAVVHHTGESAGHMVCSLTPDSGSGGAVTTVFGRDGEVVAEADDYAASLITNDSSVVGAVVSDALDTLQTAIDANIGSVDPWIWSPDGTVPPGGRVYADLNLLFEELSTNTVGKQRILIMDDGLANYLPVPPRSGEGSIYDFENRIYFESGSTDPSITVYPLFPDGTTCINMYYVGTGVFLSNDSDTVPTFTLPTTDTYGLFVFADRAGLYNEVGKAPVLHAEGGNWFFYLGQGAYFGDGTPVLSVGIDAWAAVYAIGADSGVFANSISGPVGAELYVSSTADASTPAGVTFPAFLGTFVVDWYSRSQQVQYDATTPGDWSVVPSNVKSALDALAASRMHSTVPATAGAAGVQGQLASDASFLYVCVATNTWKRVAIATW